MSLQMEADEAFVDGLHKENARLEDEVERAAQVDRGALLDGELLREGLVVRHQLVHVQLARALGRCVTQKKSDKLKNGTPTSCA